MAITVASMLAVLGLDKRGFDSGLKESSKQLGSFGASVSGVVGTIGAIGAAVGVFAGVGAAVAGMTNAAREAAAINRDLEQTIKSTGGVAGVTADAARDLADSLSRVTNFEDDAIVKGEAMLLTFTKIGSDVFPLATEAMLDMAQKFGSMDSASIQLGKALNDPIRGITALQRIGVTFSATQKQQIKDFMAVNDIASAQKVILGELATEFGGQARAAADPVIQLGNAVGNLGEALGTYFLPVLNQIVSSVLPGFLDLVKVLGEVMPGMGAMMAEAWRPIFEFIGSGLADLSAAAEQLAKGVRELGAAFGFSTEGVTALRIALLPVEITFGIVGGVLKALALVVNIVGAAFQSMAFVVDKVGIGWQRLTGEGTALGAVASTLTNWWNTMSEALAGLNDWIQRSIEAWKYMLTVMSQPLNTPPALTPGSPFPMTTALEGLNKAMLQTKAIGGLSSVLMGGGLIASAATAGGNTYRTTNLNMGGQSFGPFKGDDANEQALRTMLKYVRGKLESGR